MVETFKSIDISMETIDYPMKYPLLMLHGAGIFVYMTGPCLGFLSMVRIWVLALLVDIVQAISQNTNGNLQKTYSWEATSHVILKYVYKKLQDKLSLTAGSMRLVSW